MLTTASHAIQQILDRDLATIRAGGTIERAGIRVTMEGLIVSGQTTATPWLAIDRIDMTPSLARIQPRGGLRKITHPMVSSGPRTLCLLLKQLGIQSSFDPLADRWMQSLVRSLRL